MSITLTAQDQNTIRVAAYGAVTLLSAAAAAGGSPHRIAANGSIALGSATGPVGHVLAKYPNHKEFSGRTVADIADRVLPALTAATALLRTQDPAEATNFRTTVLLALQTGMHNTRPTPAVTGMLTTITTAIDAT